LKLFRKILGKSKEGRKFKSRISFWTLRPTAKWGFFLVQEGTVRERDGVPPAGLGKGMVYWLG